MPAAQDLRRKEDVFLSIYTVRCTLVSFLFTLSSSSSDLIYNITDKSDSSHPSSPFTPREATLDI